MMEHIHNGGDINLSRNLYYNIELDTHIVAYLDHMARRDNTTRSDAIRNIIRRASLN